MFSNIDIKLVLLTVLSSVLGTQHQLPDHLLPTSSKGFLSRGPLFTPKPNPIRPPPNTFLSDDPIAASTHVSDPMHIFSRFDRPSSHAVRSKTDGNPFALDHKPPPPGPHWKHVVARVKVKPVPGSRRPIRAPDAHPVAVPTKTWHRPTHDQAAHFRARGQLVGSLAYGHLVLDVDLAKLVSENKRLCKDLEAWNHDRFNSSSRRTNVYYKAMAVMYLQRCMATLYNLDETRHTWAEGNYNSPSDRHSRSSAMDMEDEEGLVSDFSNPGSAVERSKRFAFSTFTVAALLVTWGIAAISSTLFSSMAMIDINSSRATSPVAVHVLQSHETRVTVNEESIRILNSTLADLLDQTKYSQYILQLSTLADPTIAEYSRINKGLQQLHSGRLSPQLVRSYQLRDVMKNLKHKLLTRNIVMISNNVEDLFKFETSTIAFSNGTIRIFVHIPAYTRDSMLDLHELIPTPIRITNGKFMTPSVPRTLLGVSSKQEKFRELSYNELHECRSLNNIWYCDHANFYQLRYVGNCIVNLWLHDSERILETCKFAFLQDRDAITQLSPNEFLVYLENSTTVTRSCPMVSNTPDSVTLSGLQSLTAEPGCRISTPDYLMDGTTAVYTNPMAIDVKTLDFTGYLEEVMEASDQAFYELSMNSLRKVGDSIGLKIQDVRDLLTQENTAVFKWNMGKLLLSLIALGALLLALAYLYRRSSCSSRSQTQRGNDVYEMTEQEDPTIPRISRRRLSKTGRVAFWANWLGQLNPSSSSRRSPMEPTGQRQTETALGGGGTQPVDEEIYSAVHHPHLGGANYLGPPSTPVNTKLVN